MPRLTQRIAEAAKPGAKDVIVRRPTRAARDGERGGVPTVSMHWEIAWT